MSEPIHIGTSGWSYDDWVGPFYPQGTPARDFLATYAERFVLLRNQIAVARGFDDRVGAFV